MLLLSGAFVVLGIWLVPRNAVVGYVSIAFFGLGVLIAALNLHPRSSYLLIDVGGFTFSSLFRSHFVPWSHVERFIPTRVALTPMVGWNFTPEYRKFQALRRVNSGLAGAEAALPDTYGKSVAELTALMEACREKYGYAVPEAAASP